jgi:hypothetical protein
MIENDLIIEIGAYQLSKNGKVVCGDTFLSKKVAGENRYVAVLSDGLGSGIKANVLSSLTASMALNFRLHHEPIINSAKWIMDTLPIDSIRGISYSTFTIVDVDFEGDTTVIEYGNPSFFIERNGEIINPSRETMQLNQSGELKELEVSSFNLLENDRLVMVSDGITQSGIGNATMPFGWGNDNLRDFVINKNTNNKFFSASELAMSVVKKASQNDIYKLQDDASCAVFFRRKPRQLLICSGPPYTAAKDKYLANAVKNFKGNKILCGGTTSNIISRELNLEIVPEPIEKMIYGLPPAFKMEGIDLVTEGILTLETVYKMLKIIQNQEIPSDGPAADIVRYMMNADVIHFLVGTCVNMAHQDPNLPVELEIRRNVIKKIIRILEEKFLKQVEVQYI